MEAIAAQTKAHFESRTGLKFDLLRVKWGEFDDGMFFLLFFSVLGTHCVETENSEFLEIHRVERRHVIFMCSFSSPKEQLRQFRAMYVTE
jgi:hypothetical protein